MPFEVNNNDIPLDDSFKSPTSLYRGAPFWAWNGDMEKDEVLRQIDVFNEMGIGGYHIHSRTGLSTDYLGDEFMDLVKACRDHGREKKMLTWLYDEDRWPSGAAGGLVTKDERYRRRHLLFTSTPYAGQKQSGGLGNSSAAGSRKENGKLLATYAITLSNGYLSNYRIIDTPADLNDGESCWYAYLEVDTGSAWFNGETYVDTLNPDAMKRFVEITHERYKEAVGDSFGTDVPAIFTDEPQFTHKRGLKFADSKQDAIFPWTDDLDESFAKQFNEPITAHLPEVIWDLPGNAPSLWRYRYHEWVAERFAVSFADLIGNWCEENGIALTGHMMEESTLGKQTKALGDCMRSYRSMQIPGIDMLCDWFEVNTAKQAQSAARQYGRPGVLSELYGVTGWHYDFKGHKAQGDWQAALGVLFRVHHLSWYCMRGEAKRDYPASISYQSPWYKEYPVIEDHFARVGSVLSRGKAVCKVGVIHPVESYWLDSGPNDTSGIRQGAREENFTNMTDWLLNSLIDFDFIAESLLPDQKDSASDKTFGVGEMEYQVVVVPGLTTIRGTTVDRLEAFANAGGRVIFAGEIPSLVDAQPSRRAVKLAEACETMPFERVPLLDALRPHRDIEFITNIGMRPTTLMYQMREEGEERYLFVCNTDRGGIGSALTGKLYIAGDWKVTAMITNDGSQTDIAAAYQSGRTVIDAQIPPVGHFLLRFKPGRREEGESMLPAGLSEVGRLESPVAVTLDEPNVLLIEKAQFSINGGDWQSEAQLLDVENILRKELGMPLKQGHIVQPWVDQSAPVDLAKIALKVAFESKVNVSGAALALENIEESQIILDGTAVPMTATGYFTDKCLSTVALPDFGPGKHTIIIDLSFTKKTSIEWMYLLGDFGVTLEGTHGVLTEPVRTLSFGDWTVQGLPFYGGNVIYHCTATADGTVIQIPQYRGTTIRVACQGETCSVYRQPYIGEIPLKSGESVDITVFGHRANCFGPVHLPEPLSWLGPQSWRTSGHLFSPEYHLKPLGLMSAPIVLQKA